MQYVSKRMQSVVPFNDLMQIKKYCYVLVGLIQTRYGKKPLLQGNCRNARIYSGFKIRLTLSTRHSWRKFQTFRAEIRNTFLRLVSSRLLPDEGEIFVPTHLRVLFVSWHSCWNQLKHHLTRVQHVSRRSIQLKLACFLLMVDVQQ